MVTTISSQAHRESGALEEHQTPGSARNTTLLPPGTQYGATQGKGEKRNPLTNGGFAIPCKPLQHLMHQS
jgi:hypothetical protein